MKETYEQLVAYADQFPACRREVAPEERPDVAIAQKIADHINSGVSMLFVFSARVYVSPSGTVVNVFVREATSAESIAIDIDTKGKASFGETKSLPRLAELYRIVKSVHERVEDPFTEIENARALMAEKAALGGQVTRQRSSPEVVAALTARMRASRWGRVDRLTEVVKEKAGLAEFIARVEELLAGAAVTEVNKQVVRKRLADQILKRGKPEVGDENMDA